MTQRAIGQAGPRTMPGRFVAMLWMVDSIIAIAVFTAGITSALTVPQLQGNVQGVTDLFAGEVGAVAGSSTEEALARIRTTFPPSRVRGTACRRCAPAGSTPSSTTAP